MHRQNPLDQCYTAILNTELEIYTQSIHLSTALATIACTIGFWFVRNASYSPYRGPCLAYHRFVLLWH
jgi:hypothetical protein